MRLGMLTALAFGIFVLCCLTILFAHREISEYPLAVQAILGLSGTSAILWPILLVRFFRQFLSDKFSKRKDGR